MREFWANLAEIGCPVREPSVLGTATADIQYGHAVVWLEHEREDACDICGYEDCICDAKADAEWEEQQEYGANRCPPRE